MSNKYAAAIKAHRADVPPPPDPVPSPAPSKPPAAKKLGKRRDPAFVQVTAYISDDLNRKVKAALIERRRERDFSGVVAELLEGWVTGLPRTQHGDTPTMRRGG
jgi:hypothetical protein